MIRETTTQEKIAVTNLFYLFKHKQMNGRKSVKYIFRI